MAIAARCGACTLVYPAVRVGPNFRVRVEDNGHPVKGLRVEIDSVGRGNRATVVTDQNGFALFRGFRPGSYHLSPDHDAGVADGAGLEVRPDGPTDVIVPLRWKNIPPLSVRSLRGTIRGPDYVIGRSQPRLSLDLLEGSSGRKLKSFQTTDSGEFNLERTEPGLYFLSLKPSGLTDSFGEQLSGPIAVTVDRGAATDHLDLDLGSSSCGLWYADRSQCAQSDLRIEKLSGQVVDPAGTLVEQLQSDRAGRFNPPHSLAGTYELVVSSPGFAPLRRTATVEPTADSTGLSLLTVRLGIGSCSTVDPQ
jgi:hypothetical protein